MIKSEYEAIQDQLNKTQLELHQAQKAYVKQNLALAWDKAKFKISHIVR